MKRIVLKTYAKMLTAFFTLLGTITGCDFILPRVEYGTPSADFVIRGKVSDKSSQKPIRDIRIIHKTGYAPANDTVKTDANGEFELKFNEFPGVNHWIYAEDLDETENGGFYAPDSLTVNSSQMKRIKKGSGSWNEGVFEKTDSHFQLKKETAAMPGAVTNEDK
ncbi:MAG: radical SAM-associated putative lipoprotein [Bacteroidia bacterium]|nr:radical SAM-associated putative lipoprotein [Bacteroidia bacterium]